MKVIAFNRTQQGTGASRRLRNAGQTPGIIYGGTAAPVAIALDHRHPLMKLCAEKAILKRRLRSASASKPVPTQQVEQQQTSGFTGKIRRAG